MNSIKIEVVEIDAAGNGLGIAHIKGFNNAKLGVELKGIKVKEGGCIYAGQAITNSVDLALLNQKQHAALAQAYAAYNKALDKIEENAEGVAETYNSVADLFNGIAKKTQNLIDKLNSGQKITQKEKKELDQLKKQASIKMNKSTDYFLKSLGSEGSQPILEIIKSANESCICNLETEEIKKGPAITEEFINLEDCKKCLEEQKKKQEQAALIAKAFSNKFESMKNKKMECGCGWNSIVLAIQSFGDNGDCEEIVSIMNKAKSDLSNIGSADFSVKNLLFDENKPTGQVSIGDICIDNFSVKSIPNSARIVLNRDKKTQYNDPAVEISSNNITIRDYSNPGTNLVIGTDDNEQAKLVEKWMFEDGNNGESKNNNGDILDDEIYRKYAKLAGIKDFIAFKAFAIVESGGNGFFEVDGKKVPKLLFERHLMYKCLKNGKIWNVISSDDPRKDESIILTDLLINRPEIVAKTGFEWCKKCNSTNNYVIKGKDCETSSHGEDWFYNNCYIPTSENYEKRFLEAVKIHKECAYMATSWGLGQVIGANFRNEFNSIEEMEKELMTGNSSSQLFIMATFIKNNSNLKNAINKKDWATAALIYNGSKYKKNKYDEKLKNAYEKLKK
jgi:hypothetical protein